MIVIDAEIVWILVIGVTLVYIVCSVVLLYIIKRYSSDVAENLTYIISKQQKEGFDTRMEEIRGYFIEMYKNFKEVEENLQTVHRQVEDNINSNAKKEVDKLIKSIKMTEYDYRKTSASINSTIDDQTKELAIVRKKMDIIIKQQGEIEKLKQRIQRSSHEY